MSPQLLAESRGYGYLICQDVVAEPAACLIIGAQIKRLAALCADILGKFPGFRVEVHDGKGPLMHIFRVGLWSLRGERGDIVHIYRFLTEKAEEFGAEVEDGLFAKLV